MFDFHSFSYLVYILELVSSATAGGHKNLCLLQMGKGWLMHLDYCDVCHLPIGELCCLNFTVQNLFLQEAYPFSPHVRVATKQY